MSRRPGNPGRVSSATKRGVRIEFWPRVLLAVAAVVLLVLAILAIFATKGALRTLGGGEARRVMVGG